MECTPLPLLCFLLMLLHAVSCDMSPVELGSGGLLTDQSPSMFPVSLLTLATCHIAKEVRLEKWKVPGKLPLGPKHLIWQGINGIVECSFEDLRHSCRHIWKTLCSVKLLAFRFPQMSLALTSMLRTEELIRPI